MIDLYYWTTPNGHKITMFLEEAGLEYTIVPINISKGEQFAADFLKVAAMLQVCDQAMTGTERNIKLRSHQREQQALWVTGKVLQNGRSSVKRNIHLVM